MLNKIMTKYNSRDRMKKMRKYAFPKEIMIEIYYRNHNLVVLNFKFHSITNNLKSMIKIRRIKFIMMMVKIKMNKYNNNNLINNINT